MKKMVAFALPLVMLLTLMACGNTDASEGQKESSNPAAVPSEQGEVQQDEAGQEMPQQEIDMDTKTLVVYFSCTGTTKPLAEYAAEHVCYRIFLLAHGLWSDARGCPSG